MSKLSSIGRVVGSRRDRSIDLSHRLSKVLRHKAVEMGIDITPDGYVSIGALLNHREFRDYSISDIIEVVDNNDKKRFELLFDETNSQPKAIRAVQGHSMSRIDTDLLLTQITDPSEIPVCLHGTYRRHLDSILSSGLNKMGRNHIHFAAGRPEEVISGSRKNVEVLIYIDVPRAMADGIQFYRSKNGVILSSGRNNDGIIPSSYFERIVDYNESI